MGREILHAYEIAGIDGFAKARSGRRILAKIAISKEALKDAKSFAVMQIMIGFLRKFNQVVSKHER